MRGSILSKPALTMAAAAALAGLCTMTGTTAVAAPAIIPTTGESA